MWVTYGAAIVAGAWVMAACVRQLARRLREVRGTLPDEALVIKPPVVRFSGFEPEKFLAGKRRHLQRQLAQLDDRPAAPASRDLPRLRVAVGQGR